MSCIKSLFFAQASGLDLLLGVFFLQHPFSLNDVHGNGL